MAYRGHVKNGTVVFDEPVSLPEGTEVRVEPVNDWQKPEKRMPLRGTRYRFDEPFAPALDPDEWNASR